MELKQVRFRVDMKRRCSLNRTFYGIETQHNHQHHQHNHVLIVPFMELKPAPLRLPATLKGVLIVPFMELKLADASG